MKRLGRMIRKESPLKHQNIPNNDEIRENAPDDAETREDVPVDAEKSELGRELDQAERQLTKLKHEFLGCHPKSPKAQRLRETLDKIKEEGFQNIVDATQELKETEQESKAQVIKKNMRTWDSYRNRAMELRKQLDEEMEKHKIKVPGNAQATPAVGPAKRQS
ncbi:MAG: hypothetical protein Q9162_002320 [Coniocarpon cinnabarinum]